MHVNQENSNEEMNHKTYRGCKRVVIVPTCVCLQKLLIREHTDNFILFQVVHGVNVNAKWQKRKKHARPVEFKFLLLKKTFLF